MVGITKLREDIQRCKKGGTAHYSKELREQVVQFARERLKDGKSLSDVSREVTISWSTLRDWLDTPKAVGFEPSHQLVPVHLIEDSKHPPHPNPTNEERQLSFLTPNGYRLEHLSLNEAIELVERLG